MPSSGCGTGSNDGRSASTSTIIEAPSFASSSVSCAAFLSSISTVRFMAGVMSEMLRTFYGEEEPDEAGTSA